MILPTLPSRMYVFLFPIILFSACSEDSSVDPNDLNDTGFPLKAGNTWEYRKTDIWWTEESFEDTTKSVSVGVWKITGREIVDGIDAYRMEVNTTFVAGPDSGSSGTITNWYAVVNDTLKWIAYSEESGVIDRGFQLYKEAIEYPIEESIADGWQSLVLVFPLKIGKTWMYQPGRDFLGEKTIVDVEKVTVPAGTFDAYKVRRDLNPDNENMVPHIKIYDETMWYSSIGLLRINIYRKTFYPSNPEQPTDETLYSTTEIELTDYSIK